MPASFIENLQLSRIEAEKPILQHTSLNMIVAAVAAAKVGNTFFFVQLAQLR
jgi:hypothetical protein